MNWKNVEFCKDCKEWHIPGYCSEKNSALTEDEELEMLLLQGDKDDDVTASGMHCTRHGCNNHVASTLCGIIEGKMVPLGTQGAKVECKNLGSCKGTSVVYSYSAKCRHKATAAYALSDITFHGGSESKVEDETFDKDWLVVRLLGAPRDKTTLWSRLPNVVKALNMFVAKSFSPDISIDWRDYQAPPVAAGFWDALLEIAKKQKVKNVLFYCIGGHGRTGTALTAMLIECCGLTPAEAVTYVRENYCKEAVESSSQKEYLKSLYESAQDEVENTIEEVKAKESGS